MRISFFLTVEASIILRCCCIVEQTLLVACNHLKSVLLIPKPASQVRSQPNISLDNFRFEICNSSGESHMMIHTIVLPYYFISQAKDDYENKDKKVVM